MLHNIMHKKPLPVYGKGENVRVFPIPTLVPDSPWSVAIASPGDGIHVSVRRDEQEPL